MAPRAALRRHIYAGSLLPGIREFSLTTFSHSAHMTLTTAERSETTAYRGISQQGFGSFSCDAWLRNPATREDDGVAR
jgi:hypothetical protein